jgi:hypothetical protein
MISSVNALATNAVTVLTAQRRAAVPVEPVAPIRAIKRRTGYTDDIFKAGKAIGDMVAIAAKLDGSDRPRSSDDTDGSPETAAAAPARWTKAYIENEDRPEDRSV